MLTAPQLFEIVTEEIRNLLEDDLENFETISRADSLHDLALNSLLLARLIIALEMEIGVDPFANGHAISDVRTVGDLVDAYEQMLATTAAEPVSLNR
jgi:acyl carrier protein